MESINKKTAILVVSFGTSYEATRKKTIDKIEEAIQNTWPQCEVRRAWTSRMILKKVHERDGIHYDNVCEAMERLYADGYQRVIVQPTHILGGIENDRMHEEIEKYEEAFEQIRFGAPLLETTQDFLETAQVVFDEFGNLSGQDVLVLMGHGTAHQANAVYRNMNEIFHKNGYENVFVGTVEGTPTLEDVRCFVEAHPHKTVHLAPLMLVAGEHVLADMAGEDETSWKKVLTRDGYRVVCHIKGLGEYPEIRKIYLNHLRAVIS